MTVPNLDNLYRLIEQGGPIIIVLLILSIAALTVALLKAGQFLIKGVGRERRTINAAVRQWRDGNHPAAIQQIRNSRDPLASFLRTAMQGVQGTDIPAAEQWPPRPLTLVREEIESRAAAHLASLRTHLRVLEATSQLAPLIGLFGTVIGMMSAFKVLQAAGTGADPSALAGGIWTALITTAVGLAVAIPAALALYWFEGRLAREQSIIETTVTAVLTHPVPSQMHSEPPIGAIDAAH